MSSATFHLFSNLPWELRRQIWEAATRPTGRHYTGIHNFSIFNNEYVANKSMTPHIVLPYKHVEPGKTFVATVIGLGDHSTTNRSAYLWDAGLWTACWESREVIMSRLSMSQWNEKRRHLADLYEESLVRSFDPELDLWERVEELPAMSTAPPLRVGGEDEQWQLMVRPYQDAFNLDFTDLVSTWVQSNYSLDNLIWRKIFYDLPFSSPSRGCGPVRNLVVDFDPSVL
ncbi:hypothetical protein QQX98_011135 [Neonectria punicea]|uniref:2EXR domain-containing protein n=1 Tax=Neonectria punicea TaxID=979145 RepID=A0ABR1GMT1_9HYPO